MFSANPRLDFATVYPQSLSVKGSMSVMEETENEETYKAD